MKSARDRILTAIAVLAAGNLIGCGSLTTFGSKGWRSQRSAAQTPPEDSEEVSGIDAAQQRINLLEARAVLFEMDERPVEAIGVYESILEDDPEHVTAHHRLAILNVQQGNDAEADEHFQEAIRLASESAPLQKDYGYYCHLRGKADLALSHLTRAVELDPNLLEAHNILGLVYASVGQYEDAEKHFLLAKCTRAEMLNNLAFARLMESDLDQATAFYTRALQSDPTQANARNSLDSLQRMSASQRITAANPVPVSSNPASTGASKLR